MRRHKGLARKRGMANAYTNLGIICRRRGDLDTARSFWLKSRDLYSEIGMPHMVETTEGRLERLPD